MALLMVVLSGIGGVGGGDACKKSLVVILMLLSSSGDVGGDNACR